ncbi:unnamed protein product [Linum tenue]|uniref:Uncharacterized protein n=1 Tax=Linum tenue TaxID=586396 RepID=A0AAV0KP30_9ROSI|nr:unnamed protein product [Linum tenue]
MSEEARKEAMNNPNNSRWKQRWLLFKRNSLLSSTKYALVKFTSTVRGSSRGRKKQRGLVALHKDMESCGEYTDIQVMWEMLHSYHHPSPAPPRRRGRSSATRRVPCFGSCFRPT